MENEGMDKFVYLPVETMHRELASKLLLACHAAERGFKVLMGWDEAVFGLLRRASEDKEFKRGIPNGVMLYNGLSDGEFNQILTYRKAGAVIFSMSEEALKIGDWVQEKDDVKSSISDDTLSLAHTVLCWGDIHKKVFSHFFPQGRGRMEIAGNHRYDLYKPQYRPFFAGKKEELQKKYGKFFLVNTNFGVSTKEDIDFKVANNVFHMSSTDENYAYKFRKILNARFLKREKLLALMDEILINFPDYNIILRPHPTEDVAVWKSLLADFKRTYVVKEDIAASWMSAAQAVLHMGCTTGSEAICLDVPSICYQPFSLPFEKNSVMSHGISCQKNSEVLDALSKITKSESIHSKQDYEKLQSNIDNYKGDLSSSRIVDLLENMDWEKDVVRTSLPLGIQKRAVVNRSPKATSRRLKNKFPGTSLDELKRNITVFSKLSNGRFDGVSTQQVGEQLFIVE
jgi:surface carbohydrate biosynthesis protein